MPEKISRSISENTSERISEPEGKELSGETQKKISDVLIETKTGIEEEAINRLLEGKKISEDVKNTIKQLREENKNPNEILTEVKGWKHLGEEGKNQQRKVQVLEAASKIDINKQSRDAKKLTLNYLNGETDYLNDLLEAEEDAEKKEKLENKINSLREVREELAGNIIGKDFKQIEDEIAKSVADETEVLKNDIKTLKDNVSTKQEEFDEEAGNEEPNQERMDKLRDELKKLGEELSEKEGILNQDRVSSDVEKELNKIGTLEEREKVEDEILKAAKQKEGEGKGEGKAEGEIRFKEEEMPWSEEALRRSNREFLEEYGLVPELNEKTLGNIDKYLKDSIFKEQLKMAKEWAKIGDNPKKIKEALGGREKFSDRELVAEVKRMGGFEEMMEGKGLPEAIEEAKDRWKQLNMLRETWKNGEAPAQAAGLTLYEFEKKKGLKKGEGLKGEVDRKKKEVQEHWEELVGGKFAPEVRKRIQKEYEELLGELEEKEKELQTLQDTEKDILEATSGRDLEKEARGKIMGDLMDAGNQLETDSGRKDFAGKMGWKIEELSFAEKAKRKVKGEPTDVVKVIYETGKIGEIAKSKLKEKLIEGYKDKRQREEMTTLIEEAAPSKDKAVKNAYEALKGSLIQQAKEKLNEVASPEKLGKIKERVGEGEIDPVAAIEGLNKGILKKGFFGNLEKDYGMLNGVVGSAGFGELPDINTISDERKAGYEKIVKSKDRLGLIGWIIDLLLREVKEE